jgi:hypothetical protein
MNGLAGLMINEATVKGVVKSRGRMLAMVQAPDNKTYIVKASDRLLTAKYAPSPQKLSCSCRTSTIR